jgi:hypothetical protein
MFARKQLQAGLAYFGRKIFEALLMVSPEMFLTTPPPPPPPNNTIIHLQ